MLEVVNETFSKLAADIEKLIADAREIVKAEIEWEVASVSRSQVVQEVAVVEVAKDFAAMQKMAASLIASESGDDELSPETCEVEDERKAGFICGCWKRLDDGCVARCDQADMHKGDHLDSVIDIAWGV